MGFGFLEFGIKLFSSIKAKPVLIKACEIFNHTIVIVWLNDFRFTGSKITYHFKHLTHNVVSYVWQFVILFIMMNPLTLYKEIFCDYSDGGLNRILFENEFIYLYIWIDRNNELDSFQTILKEKTVLIFKRPDMKSFRNIGRAPFNRVLGETAGPEDQNCLIHEISRIENETFPDLIRKIKLIAEGKQVENFKLENEELKVFKELKRLPLYSP